MFFQSVFRAEFFLDETRRLRFLVFVTVEGAGWETIVPASPSPGAIADRFWFCVGGRLERTLGISGNTSTGGVLRVFSQPATEGALDRCALFSVRKLEQLSGTC